MKGKGEVYMKFKLLVKVAALILGAAYREDEPRADMYLPIWILALALVLFLAAVGIIIAAVLTAVSVGAIIAVMLCLLLGELALLCWKNQSIRMLSDDAFEYTTFLGSKKEYRFDAITMLRKNNDSMTMFVGGGKVHIESCAILSDRLVERINRQLDVLYGEQEE